MLADGGANAGDELAEADGLDRGGHARSFARRGGICPMPVLGLIHR
jgi:hypothetical protein